ncbi:MAG: hypothetical protein QW472_02225 [Candidatus Aenigmatarchaeota archaeon]
MIAQQKLQEIGQKLNITDEDIKNIKKAGLTNKILYWITTAIIAIISFIIGFFAGKVTCPSTGGGGYPYAAGLVIPNTLISKKRNSKIAILLLSVIVFLVAIKLSPAFGQAIKYNVYKR